MALFFVTIGAFIEPRAVVGQPALFGAIVSLIVLGKLVVWTLVVWLFERPFWTALPGGRRALAIGESRHPGPGGAGTRATWRRVSNATLAASLLTIMIDAVLMRERSRVGLDRPARPRGSAS